MLARSLCRAAGAEQLFAAASWTLAAQPRVELDLSDFEVETGGESSNSRLPAVRRKPVGLFGMKAYYQYRNLFGISVAAMDLDRSFGFLVHDVARLFARRFNQRAMLFLGLTRAQCKVLGYLARN